MTKYQLSDFEILKALNEKQNVFLMRHKGNGQHYVKKIYEQYDIKIYEQLKRDCHVNLVHICDYFELDETLVVIEEYIQGLTLCELLEERGPLPEQMVKDITQQLCDGLNHLHHMSPPLIHRDIKLSNVMLTRQGIVKLIDFDISRIYKEHVSKDTEILGTAGYAAPEQFGFRQTDARSDIYSVGVLMNCLLTGKHPGEQLTNSVLRVVIERCIQLDPGQRYPNMIEVKHALEGNAKFGSKTGIGLVFLAVTIIVAVAVVKNMAPTERATGNIATTAEVESTQEVVVTETGPDSASQKLPGAPTDEMKLQRMAELEQNMLITDHLSEDAIIITAIDSFEPGLMLYPYIGIRVSKLKKAIYLRVGLYEAEGANVPFDFDEIVICNRDLQKNITLSDFEIINVRNAQFIDFVCTDEMMELLKNDIGEAQEVTVQFSKGEKVLEYTVDSTQKQFVSDLMEFDSYLDLVYIKPVS